MRRRDFITLLGGVGALWPLAARAQQAVHLIGFLVSGAPDSFAIFVDAFKQGMFDNGLVEGRDYVLDLRFAEGDYKRAFHQLLPLACNGNPCAQYAVGYLYYYGYGVPEDSESGIFWMQKAASQGYVPAIKALSEINKT